MKKSEEEFWNCTPKKLHAMLKIHEKMYSNDKKSSKSKKNKQSNIAYGETQKMKVLD